MRYALPGVIKAASTFVLLCLCLWLPLAVFAHGGEDHDSKAAPITGPEGSTIAANGKVFDAVIKVPFLHSGHESTTKIFISDYETNSPIANADIDITFKGANGFKVSGKATATKAAGIYEFSLIFPLEGEYDADILVQSKDKIDALIFPKLSLKRASELTPTSEANGRLFLEIVGALSFIVVGIIIGRLSKKSRAQEAA